MGQPYTMGDLGGIVVDSTSGALTGLQCRSIQVVNEAVLSNFTVQGVTGYALIEGLTLPAGLTMLFGKGITEVTVTSGVIYLGA